MSDGLSENTRKRGILSNRKLLVFIVVVIVLLFSAGVLVTSLRKSEYNKLLGAFDTQLKMDTQAQFEASMENMKLLIENTATQVSRRGWSKGDINRFYENTDERFKQFIRSMETAAAGETSLYGHDCRAVRDSLCGGMHMVILSIRNKDIRLERQLVAAYQSSGGYVLCNVAAYKPSSNMKLVRDGDGFALREKTDMDRSAEKLLAAREKNLPLPGGTTTPAAAPSGSTSDDDAATKRRADDLAISAARGEIFRMWHAYKKKNGKYCYDARELMDSYKTDGGQVSQRTEELIKNGDVIVEEVGSGITVRGK